MSEAAPGYADSPDFGSPERARLASALRDAIDATMTVAGAPAQTLIAAAEQVEAATRALVGDDRARVARRDRHRSHDEYLPRSPVVGGASPLAPGSFDWEVVDDPATGRRRVVAECVMPAAYEGPPGYVHGGMIALCFDEMLGIVNIANGCPGMTGTLSVRYRRPTPLFEPLRWEARLDDVDGRRIRSQATVTHGETLCAQAEGLFIEVRPEIRAVYFPGVAAAADTPEA